MIEPHPHTHRLKIICVCVCIFFWKRVGVRILSLSIEMAQWVNVLLLVSEPDDLQSIPRTHSYGLSSDLQMHQGMGVTYS